MGEAIESSGDNWEWIVVIVIGGGGGRLSPAWVFPWLERGLHAAIPASCMWGSFG
jgi:hypothetical protein